MDSHRGALCSQLRWAPQAWGHLCCNETDVTCAGVNGRACRAGDKQVAPSSRNGLGLQLLSAMQWDLEAMISLLLSRAPKPELGSRPLLALLAGLFVLFLWYCYRIGTEDQEPDSSSSRRTRGRIKALGVSGAMGGEVGLGIIGITPSEHGYFSPISSGHPFQDLDQVSPGRRKLYRSLQDYAKRYSWSGMGRVHKGVREQARYLSDRLSIQKPKLFYLPDVPSMPYFTRDAQRHDIEVLEASFPAILAEFEVVYQRGLEGKLGWTSGGTQAKGHFSFFLFTKGVWVPQNCRSCPRTYRVLSSLRTFINGNIFGNAGFSLLQPGTSLPGTYGPTNTRLRCHLGLKVPTGCELVVGGEPQCWSEGYCLLVDDSFLHTTAHNGSPEDGPCVVFTVDLWHPNVAAAERQALDYIFAPGR
ncbi:aspartate beta-hydroxylase domain-containing protein 2 isoform X1 [Polypterus senegalus]|uniref:aspartate beta-hydroxylase domain-containing protein 2 isoform X1 n=2 Tax=Polypterus senegalus TaxID=55291 RepID=UPI001962549F|nr:aspartate beta-hydroxylase domain-containing protein 2 isoform X1 [Polypterus senegalus]